MKKYVSLILICIVIIINFIPVVNATETNIMNEGTDVCLSEEYKNNAAQTNKETNLNENPVEEEIFNDGAENNTDKAIKNTSDELSKEINSLKQEREEQYINMSEEESTIKDETMDKNNYIQENNKKVLDEIGDEPQEKSRLVASTDVQGKNEPFSISVDVSGYTINTYYRDNVYYLFLPNQVNLDEIEIDYTGNVTATSCGVLDQTEKKIRCSINNNSEFTINVGETVYNVKVMQSDLPCMSIELNGVTLNQINQGSKDVKYPENKVSLYNATDTQYNFSNSIAEIKGRGNVTWRFPKRGYQIKFSKKVNILNMGKAKTWVLLANYADPSLMRNKAALELAKDMEMEFTSNSEFIDLWVDGNYQGNYLLVEKVQVGENRVNLENDEGIIAELDNNYYTQEKNYFESKTSNTHFVLKDSVADDENDKPSQALNSFKQFEKYINEFETYLYSDSKDWNKISSMIDVDSFVKYYFIQEISEDPDACRSSVFLYKDGKNDVLHIGPVWDYDSAFGNYTEEVLRGNTNVDYVVNIKGYMSNSNDWFNQLMQIREFRELVSQEYNSNVKYKLDNMCSSLDNYKSKITQSANMNFIKWKVLGEKSPFGTRITSGTYDGEVTYLSNWINNRKEYLDKRYNTASNICNIKYSSHVENTGWENSFSKSNGEKSGVEGQARRLEAIMINLDSFNSKILNNGSVKYKVHVQDYGWMNWKSNGQIAGTVGEAKRIEAIQIKLDNLPKYSVRYRVHIQDIGWTDWYYDGQIAGTVGRSLRIEAIQIEILERQNYNDTSLINYNGYVENIGATTYVSNGETIGTIGKSLRLEGMTIALNSELLNDVELQINEHIQDIGWVYGLSENQYIGTRDQALRLEAITLKLKGKEADGYSIRYRAHVQDIGWQDWVEDGQIAGTQGRGLRIEAIQIKIVKK